MRGYNQEEVDEFLDKIIQDYDVFQEEIDRLKQENERLKNNPSHTEQQTRTRSSNTSQQVNSNYDVLKRLSNLEKAVFGKKYAEEDTEVK